MQCFFSKLQEKLQIYFSRYYESSLISGSKRAGEVRHLKIYFEEFCLFREHFPFVNAFVLALIYDSCIKLANDEYK